MGYGIKIFVPRPLHYVTRSPGRAYCHNVTVNSVVINVFALHFTVALSINKSFFTISASGILEMFSTTVLKVASKAVKEMVQVVHLSVHNNYSSLTRVCSQVWCRPYLVAHAAPLNYERFRGH